MNKVFIVLAVVLFLLAGLDTGAAFAEDGLKGSFSAGLQTEYLNGNTTYHISEYVGSSGIESELEFPLQTFLAGVNLAYHTQSGADNNYFHIDLSVLKNLDHGSGKMKDSDWMTNDYDIYYYGSAHPGKDIYSESDIRLKADVIDLRAVIGRGMGENATLGPVFGFKHQKFSYDISNLNQVGYGPYASDFTVSVSGLVSTYEVTYDIFYAGLVGNVKAGKNFTATGQIAFAPLAQAKDRDDHILRSKLSTCTASGTAYLASIGALWDLAHNWSLGLNAEYLNISTEGTQHQSFYNGTSTTYDIHDKITSQQLTLSASISKRF